MFNEHLLYLLCYFYTIIKSNTFFWIKNNWYFLGEELLFNIF